MRKRYIKTPEEIVALKDTDTKIRKDNDKGYYKFVAGIPCYFSSNSLVFYNTTIDFDQVVSKLYVEEEEPFKRVDENDIGRLCKFWDDDPSEGMIGLLDGISKRGDDDHPYCMDCPYGNWFKHCRLLSPSEVAKITGYKVEE